MRPNFVITILAVAILAIGTMVFLKSHHTASPAPAPAPVVSVPASAPAPAPAPVVVKKVLSPEERQAAIDVEKDKLYAWSMSSDPQSYSNIIADLISPEKDVRMAAIEATKQFGDTNAIPVLKSLAANAQDTDEAVAMLKAAEFIALPSVTWSKADPNRQLTPEEQQAQAANRAKAEARRQAILQRRNSRQNGSLTFPDAQNPQPAPANP